MSDMRYTQEIEQIVFQRMSALARRQPQELWTKPLPEVKYLNAENVGRYRLIMRFFYDNHTKLKYWLKPEEVYQGVMAWNLLADYTLEECQRDLDALAEWKNLTRRHDGGRATTIEEYLRKRFRYQMTPYSIEIERMLESLEKIQGYGGSLEPTLLERIVGYVQRIRESDGTFAEGEAGQLWRDLQGAFQRLHESASDYLASLQSARAEELMLTEQFLVFKDTLTVYLRNFVLGLQKYGGQLEELLRTTPPDVFQRFLRGVVADDLRMPNLEEVWTEQDRWELRSEEWQIFVDWFVDSGLQTSDARFLERATKESVAKVVRYALEIQEKQRWGVSRKRELDYLGQWFFSLDDVEDAHKLSAYTFGLFRTHHFQGEIERSTDASDMSMWEEAPLIRALASRSRRRGKAVEVAAIPDHSTERRNAKQDILMQKAREAALLQAFVNQGEFTMSEVGFLKAEQRAVLLGWISRCIANASGTARTADGLEIHVERPSKGERALVQCEDGRIDMPDYRITLRQVKRA